MGSYQKNDQKYSNNPPNVKPDRAAIKHHSYPTNHHQMYSNQPSYKSHHPPNNSYQSPQLPSSQYQTSNSYQSSQYPPNNVYKYRGPTQHQQPWSSSPSKSTHSPYKDSSKNKYHSRSSGSTQYSGKSYPGRIVTREGKDSPQQQNEKLQQYEQQHQQHKQRSDSPPVKIALDRLLMAGLQGYIPVRPNLEQHYTKLSQVGEGTYGKVYKARCLATGELVALKRIRLDQDKDGIGSNWREGFPITGIREIRILSSLKHKNVVQLKEIVSERRERDPEGKRSVYMVFEFMDSDLAGVLLHPSFQFNSSHIKCLMKQLFEGLDYLHSRNIIHRDIKGANLLLNNMGELKLADFGLARTMVKNPAMDYTNRVITLWYRPPELLLGATKYGPEIDMWSAGCVLLELYTRKAVFPGNFEIPQLELIWKLCGSPNTSESTKWPGVVDLPWWEMIRPGHNHSRKIKETFSKLSPQTLDLVDKLLQLDPSKRPTAKEVLKHPFFTEEQPLPCLPTELPYLEGDWHEFDSKQRKREEGRGAYQTAHSQPQASSASESRGSQSQANQSASSYYPPASSQPPAYPQQHQSSNQFPPYQTYVLPDQQPSQQQPPQNESQPDHAKQSEQHQQPQNRRYNNEPNGYSQQNNNGKRGGNNWNRSDRYNRYNPQQQHTNDRYNSQQQPLHNDRYNSQQQNRSSYNSYQKSQSQHQLPQPPPQAQPTAPTQEVTAPQPARPNRHGRSYRKDSINDPLVTVTTAKPPKEEIDPLKVLQQELQSSVQEAPNSPKKSRWDIRELPTQSKESTPQIQIKEVSEPVSRIELVLPPPPRSTSTITVIETQSEHKITSPSRPSAIDTSIIRENQDSQQNQQIVSPSPVKGPRRYRKSPTPRRNQTPENESHGTTTKREKRSKSPSPPRKRESRHHHHKSSREHSPHRQHHSRSEREREHRRRHDSLSSERDYYDRNDGYDAYYKKRRRSPSRRSRSPTRSPSVSSNDSEYRGRGDNRNTKRKRSESRGGDGNRPFRSSSSWHQRDEYMSVSPKVLRTDSWRDKSSPVGHSLSRKGFGAGGMTMTRNSSIMLINEDEEKNEQKSESERMNEVVVLDWPAPGEEYDMGDHLFSENMMQEYMKLKWSREG